MKALSTVPAAELDGFNHTLLFLKRLVDGNAPLDLIRDVIEHACQELNSGSVAEQDNRGVITSDFYLG